MTFRHLLSWKPLFYEALLPALSLLGPARADAALGRLGRLAAAAWPPRRRQLTAALRRVRTALPAHCEPEATRVALAANTLRFLARDYPLEAATDAEVFARFDVEGFAHVQAALSSGRGLILLGNHLGGYLSALHWLSRREVPLRLLVQRPQHISGTLRVQFDRGDGPYPQSEFLLRRNLAPGAAAARVLLARAALGDGLAVYMTGDIPWTGPNARPGRLLGQPRTFLSVWADLAVLARVPVVPVFCTHRPAGRYALTFDPPWTLAPGDEGDAVARFLGRLDDEIAAHPADAVAHLLWPCYAQPEAQAAERRGPHRRSSIRRRAGRPGTTPKLPVA